MTISAATCPLCGTYLELLPGGRFPLHDPPPARAGFCAASRVNVYRVRRLARLGRIPATPPAG